MLARYDHEYGTGTHECLSPEIKSAETLDQTTLPQPLFSPCDPDFRVCRIFSHTQILGVPDCLLP